MSGPSGIGVEQDCRGVAVRLIVDGNEDRLEWGRTYYVLGPHDMASLLLSKELSGDGWKVYLSGSDPILAVCERRRIEIHSLHRLEAWERVGCPVDAESCSLAALSVAGRLWGIQGRLGLRPGVGLSGAVRRLAPGLRELRRHAGDDLFARQELLRGGRVDIFRQYATEDITVWDMRSAYAGAYMHGIPGRVRRRTPGVGLPDSTDMFAARVTVSIPSIDPAPCVPRRRASDGRLMFPVGRWETWLCGPEARLCEAWGQIDRVHEVKVYETTSPYIDMVNQLWSIRSTTEDDLENAYCKLLLVSGYGCLATHTVHPIWHVRPRSLVDGELIRADVIRTYESARFPSTHVIGAAWIQSKVRARLSAALREYPEACYAHIDAIHLPSAITLPEGNAPGEWAKKLTRQGGEWSAHGTYQLGAGAVRKAIGVEPAYAAEYLDGIQVTAHRRGSALSMLESGELVKDLVSMQLAEDSELGRVPIPGDPLFRTSPYRVEDC